MAGAVVVVAGVARVEHKAQQVGLDEGVDIASAATDYPNTSRREFILRTLAHIARQHNLNTHLGQHRGYITLTTTALGRRQLLGSNNLFILNSINRIVVAVAKVVIHAPIACRYRNFHSQLYLQV